MDDLYADQVFEYEVESDGESESDELAVDEARVHRALVDLQDDFARSGAALAREEVDRAAARHGLSILEMALLGRHAESEGLLESVRDSFERLEEPSKAFSRSAESLDLVQIYLNDVTRFPLLTASEEATLARAIEAGGRAKLALEGDGLPEDDRSELKIMVARGVSARDRFIASNLRLVFPHAKVRRNQGLDFLDLLQEGTLGVIRAVDKFDYRLGYKFSTYATWWVRQSMDRALADKGRVIRLPVHVVERIRKIRSTERKITRESGREPTITEVARATGFDPADIAFLRDISRDTLSLDAPLSKDSIEPLTLLDLIPDRETDIESNVINAVEVEELRELLSSLSYRERRVLEMRFGLDEGPVQTLEEIGRTFNVTRERIRQIQDQSIKKLKVLALQSGLLDSRVAT